MSDLIALDVGRHPWKPTPESELVIEYQHYDIPLTGVIRQGGVEYLFACLDGAEDNVSVWWYTHITLDQRGWLESAATVEEFHERLHSINFESWSRLALATQRQGILDYDDVMGDSAHDVGRAYQVLLERVDSLKNEAHDLEPILI